MTEFREDVEEIRAALDTLLGATPSMYELIDDELINSDISESNADGWDVSECELLRVDFGEVLTLLFRVTLNGDQLEDKPAWITQIVAHVKVTLGDKAEYEITEVCNNTQDESWCA